MGHQGRRDAWVLEALEPLGEVGGQFRGAFHPEPSVGGGLGYVQASENQQDVVAGVAAEGYVGGNIPAGFHPEAVSGHQVVLTHRGRAGDVEAVADGGGEVQPGAEGVADPAGDPAHHYAQGVGPHLGRRVYAPTHIPAVGR